MPTAVNNAFTVLAMSGDGVAPYSCRGATQTLDPISQATSNRRTVNGVLKDISFDGFQKFKSTISCEDQLGPAFEKSWPGVTVVVECIKELCYKTAGGNPSRPVVADSSRIEGDYTYYRPQLTMMIIGYSDSQNEYAASDGWSMQLEEV